MRAMPVGVAIRYPLTLFGIRAIEEAPGPEKGQLEERGNARIDDGHMDLLPVPGLVIEAERIEQVVGNEILGLPAAARARTRGTGVAGVAGVARRIRAALTGPSGVSLLLGALCPDQLVGRDAEDVGVIGQNLQCLHRKRGDDAANQRKLAVRLESDAPDRAGHFPLGAGPDLDDHSYQLGAALRDQLAQLRVQSCGLLASLGLPHFEPLAKRSAHQPVYRAGSARTGRTET